MHWDFFFHIFFFFLHLVLPCLVLNVALSSPSTPSSASLYYIRRKWFLLHCFSQQWPSRGTKLHAALLLSTVLPPPSMTSSPVSTFALHHISTQFLPLFSSFRTSLRPSVLTPIRDIYLKKWREYTGGGKTEGRKSISVIWTHKASILSLAPWRLKAATLLLEFCMKGKRKRFFSPHSLKHVDFLPTVGRDGLPNAAKCQDFGPYHRTRERND